MIVERSLSRTSRDALAQLLANERVGRLTHRSAMHAATRESLLARGLIAWQGTGVHLHLTDDGRAVAEAMER